MSTTVIALIVIAGFGILGFVTGLIRSLGSIVGIVVGSVVATNYYRAVGGFLLPFLGKNEFLAGMTAFVLLFFLTTAVVGIAFLMIDRFFKLATVIPGLKALNKLGGLLFGVVEGALIVGVVFNAYTRLPVIRSTPPDISNAPMLQTLANSTKAVLPWLTTTLSNTLPTPLKIKL